MMLSIALLVLALAAHAETITGRLAGVSDGDTITVLDDSLTQHKVRLAEIDAPEKSQPFGSRSKESLASVVFNKPVRVEYTKHDRYDRIVAKVWAQPQSCPPCMMTLEAGHAQITIDIEWWYRKYAKEQSPADQGVYEFSEMEARAKRVRILSKATTVMP